MWQYQQYLAICFSASLSPPVQHPECQKPTALTSTHARPVRIYNTPIWYESYDLGERGIIERRYWKVLFLWNNSPGGSKEIRSRMFVKHRIRIKLIYSFIQSDDGSLTWKLIRWVICCLRRRSPSLSSSTQQKTGWLMTSTSGVFNWPVAHCLHVFTYCIALKNIFLFQ